MENKKKERIFYLDLLRAVAILAVIVCHVSGLYPNEIGGIFKPLIRIDTVGYIGVPIFFMLSGALLLNREYEFKSFLKRDFQG